MRGNCEYGYYALEVIGGEAVLERKAVRSTSIISVGYDAKAKVLEIEFGSGGVYQYAGVPETRYKSLMKASVIGSYFHHDIKPWYACRKVR